MVVDVIGSVTRQRVLDCQLSSIYIIIASQPLLLHYCIRKISCDSCENPDHPCWQSAGIRLTLGHVNSVTVQVTLILRLCPCSVHSTTTLENNHGIRCHHSDLLRKGSLYDLWFIDRSEYNSREHSVTKRPQMSTGDSKSGAPGGLSSDS